LATTTPQYQVRALDRALQILGAFSLEQPQLTLSEISILTNLAPSTALRLLSILANYGYIERSPDTDRFRIGVGMFERGSIYIQTTTVEAEATEALENLARESNQTASLAVLDRAEIVHIAVTQPDRAIRYYAPVGQREAAHCTGLGKVLLTGLTDQALEDVVAQRGLPGRTDRTITTFAALRAHVAQVREQGYAIDNEESMVGLRCVAAPVFDHRNRIVAAVSASGPSAEFNPDAMPGLVKAVKKAARTVSVRLGDRVHATAIPAHESTG
jgi:IclR family transcriptional regulator, KDG regulon repressor